MKAFQRVTMAPGNSILVIVDVENEFCKPGGAFYRPENGPLVAGVIASIRGLLEKARSAGIPTIYVQSVRTGQEAEMKLFGIQPHLIIDTWASEIVDEVKPREGDVVVQKFSHDPFFRTRLDDVLRKMVPDPGRCMALITGGAINVCVYHTILGFYLRNYWTVVVEDGVYYSLPKGKELALEMIGWRAYPNVFYTRSGLVNVSSTRSTAAPLLVPGT